MITCSIEDEDEISEKAKNFGGGPRVCIGNYFAMMEMILLMATIGRRFKFDLAPDANVELYPAMSLRPKNGVRVVVNQR